MSAITKEQLTESLQHRIYVASGFPESEKAQIDLELARIALASLEAKSRKLFTCSGCGAEGLDEPLESKCHCNEDGAYWAESVVYTAPTASASVSGAAEAIRACLDEFPEDVRDIVEECASIAENSCRDAMLHGSNPETDNTNQQFESLSRGGK